MMLSPKIPGLQLFYFFLVAILLLLSLQCEKLQKLTRRSVDCRQLVGHGDPNSSRTTKNPMTRTLSFSQRIGTSHVLLLCCFEEWCGSGMMMDDVGVVVCSLADVKHNADDLVALPEHPTLAGFEPWKNICKWKAFRADLTFSREPNFQNEHHESTHWICRLSSGE